jgi:hypothetical protein
MFPSLKIQYKLDFFNLKKLRRVLLVLIGKPLMNTSVMKCFHNFQTYDPSLIEYFCYIVQEIWMVLVLEGIVKENF